MRDQALIDHPAGQYRRSATVSPGQSPGPNLGGPTSEPSPTRTRISRAWAAITLGLGAVVAVLVFALQNIKGVEVTFLGMHWHPPLAVLLLLVATLGGLIVFAFGGARIVQLRLQARRSNRG